MRQFKRKFSFHVDLHSDLVYDHIGLLVLIFRNQPQSTTGGMEFGVEMTKNESSRLQDLKSEQVEIKF
eukprot:TRINITY_DN5_c0_g1_i5.p1 TRINITY_DN5_c0_g1~~TRINITY_DN5_c0_g1_i5.p1  ORF type:complete len:68 (+),score=5.08 TRINITY_DN5_c0_g1_i5:98-301(+)